MMESQDTKPNSSVTLLVEDEAFLCSKSMLSSSSGYFKAMFNSSMIESSADNIRIHDVPANIMQKLIDFSEKSPEDVHIEMEIAYSLLSAAFMLQFDSIVREVIKFLSSSISPCNCFGIMHAAHNCALDGLYNTANCYSLWYFDEVVLSKEFLESPLATIKDYLSCSMLNVPGELSVFKAIESWITHDSDERARHFTELFSCISLRTMSSSDLESLLHKKLVFQSSMCKTKVEDVINEQETESYQKSENQKKPSIVRGIPRSLLLVENYRGSIKSPMFHMLDEKGTNQDTITDFPVTSDLWGAGICVEGKDLYIVGGERICTGMRREWNNSVWHYDHLNEIWEVVTELPIPRRHHGVIINNHYLYVIGGIGRYRVLQKTVDRYNLKTDEWVKMPSLNTAVYSPAVCCCDGNIFVIKHEAEILHITPKPVSWQIVSMKTVDDVINVESYSDAITVGSDIFLMHSHFSINSLKKFDPVRGTVTSVGSFQHIPVKGCLHNKKIYVVAFNQQDETCHIETYDPCTGIFETMGELDFARIEKESLEAIFVLPVFPKIK